MGGLTQKAFAEKLGVSLPYLNQMENNNRPVSTGVVLALAQEFGFDVAELSTGGDAERLVTDMREALADPIFTDTPPPLADLRLAASNAPALARAFLALHRAYRQNHERLASLDEALGREGSSVQASPPWEEVRDFFHYCDNYIDAVDRAAERFTRNVDPEQAAIRALREMKIGVELHDDPQLRGLDVERSTLRLSTRTAQSTRRFQLLHQVALLAQNELLEATLDLARFQTEEARAIAKIGLANYFAGGAALLPYGAFLAAARETRHDLERLAEIFGASIEQVAHRLSTLQRPPGAKGIPFFFVRVDQAGTITKRHSATRLQFARFGGACPLWNVHQAFETPPGRFLRQLAKTPDGVSYLCLARDVSKSGGSFSAPVRRYAIGLGCEVRHAGELVYADHLDISNEGGAFEPIGISCRICERVAVISGLSPPIGTQVARKPGCARGGAAL